MAKHVFVSYSSTDKAYIRNLSKSLTGAGLEVWMDDDVEHGASWWPTIVQALRGCSAFVLVMSPRAENSDWVHRETLLAIQEEKPIFPLLLRGKVIPLVIDREFDDVTGDRMPSAKFISRLRRECGKPPRIPIEPTIDFLSKYAASPPPAKEEPKPDLGPVSDLLAKYSWLRPTAKEEPKPPAEPPKFGAGSFALGKCFCGSGKDFGDCHGSKNLPIEKSSDPTAKPATPAFSMPNILNQSDPMALGYQNCFCGSGKLFKNCHGSGTKKLWGDILKEPEKKTPSTGFSLTGPNLADSLCFCHSGKPYGECHGSWLTAKEKEPAKPPAGDLTAPFTSVLFRDQDPMNLGAQPCYCRSGKRFRDCHGLSIAKTGSGDLGSLLCHCGSGKKFRDCHGKRLRS